MNPRLDEIEALARAIDRIVFPAESRSPGEPGEQTAALALISYLNDSFPVVALSAARRERVQRRTMRALGIPAASVGAPWVRLEDEWGRRLRTLDPRWRPVVGGAAIVLLGVLGIAYIRQRGGAKGIAASLT